MRVECFGQSRPQEGRQQTQNQDAFLIGRQPVPWIGAVRRCGERAVGRRSGPSASSRRGCGRRRSTSFLRDETWLRWAKRLDSALLGGPEATFVAAAAIGDEVVGVAAGDSRAYLVPLEGPVRLLTESAAKARLGSGDTAPAVFRATLAPRDVLLLVSDGAWTPLGTAGIDRAVRRVVAGVFADLPAAVLDEASRRGRADDMTAVALRLMR